MKSTTWGEVHADVCMPDRCILACIHVYKPQRLISLHDPVVPIIHRDQGRYGRSSAEPFGVAR